ncbi:hypothetical protein [Streptomyces virginiae]|uniref:hypothetical protein n=1 Tax=Streptomyces virginiae TaxID=1961 RepID=UPI0035E1DC55
MWEGPTASLRTRSAVPELLRIAWPDWEVRWLHEGQSGLRAHLGLAPQALQRGAGPRGDARAPLTAALPHATIGHGFAPAVTAEQAAAARAAVERAYAVAVGT